MKKKRFWSFALVLCMIMSLIPGMTASADIQEWEYELIIQISDAKDSKSKDGNIKARLYFNIKNDEEVFTVENTKTSGVECRTKHVSSRAPWTMDYVQIENYTTDAFKLLRMDLRVAKKGSSDYHWMLKDYYPSGKGEKDGQWIENEDDRDPTLCKLIWPWPERKISSPGNFNDLPEKLYIDSESESGDFTYEYDGKVTDQYSDILGDNYDCMNMSAAPSFGFSVSGNKERGTVTKSELTTSGGFTLIEKDGYTRGFKIDKATLAKYMNQYNVNQITVDSTLTFPDGSVNRTSRKHSRTLTIVRKSFAVDKVSMSDNYHHSSQDNNYYNSTIKDDAGQQRISITASIRTDGNNNHLSQSNLDNAVMTFKKAYLILGNTGQQIAAAEKQVNISNNSFTLTFPYSNGMDSAGGGLRLILEQAKIKPESMDNQEFKLWDEAEHKVQFSYYASAYKVDAVNPTVALSPLNGDQWNQWHKTISFNSVPSETVSTTLGASKYNGHYTMALYNENNQPVNIYDYHGIGETATQQRVPATKGSTQEVTLALKDAIEGSFELRLSGQDAAGNNLSDRVRGILLDNKAPELTVNEDCGERATDGSKGNTYTVSISDRSGTGKMYYCFTKNLANMPECNEQTAQQQPSGTISSLEDQWAFIDQSDAEKGAAAYLAAKKGENFEGYLVYFGTDGFGNKTETTYRKIEITNEDTECSIETTNDTARPHTDYQITITTNAQNTVSYRWRDAKGELSEEYKPYHPGDDIGKGTQMAADGSMVTLDGTYTLECKVVPPSGTGKTYERDFVFDHSGPKLNVTVLAPDTYRETQELSVVGTDASGVKEGFAQLVNSDGSAIAGQDEFALEINQGGISKNLSFAELPSGAYALSVRAVDENGNASSVTSNSFYIRNAAPKCETELISALKYHNRPLISSDQYQIQLNVTEDFINAANAKNQTLYYRVSEDESSFGDWISAGEMTVSGQQLTKTVTIDSPIPTFAEGENIIYIQTAIAPAKSAKINLNTVAVSAISLFYDTTPPEITRMTIEDIHTAENISGTVALRDNLDSELKLTCADSAVSIVKEENNTFTVTISSNVNTKLIAADKAGNRTEIPLTIEGIDRTVPTGSVTAVHTNRGERTDVEATVQISDADEGDIRVALIPAAEMDSAMQNGKINEKYFGEKDGSFVSVIQTRAEDAAFENEKNLTYTVKLAGMTGEYYIGLHMADSVGNETDVIYDQTPLSVKDVELAYDQCTVAPMITDKKTAVKLHFNMPVFVLPQAKIVSSADEGISDGGTADDTNLELAKQSAAFYAQDYSFTVTKNGTYKLYTVDDLGRKKLLTVNVENVQFDSLGGVKAVTYLNDDPLKDGKMAGIYASDENGQQIKTSIRITPVDPAMQLSPKEETIPGVELNESKSEAAANGNGYTMLVYDVSPIFDEQWNYIQSNERLVDVWLFEGSTTDQTLWGEATAVVENIDNTPPEFSYRITPRIYVADPGQEVPGGEDPILYTPGNVTVTITVQDPDSGISEINLGYLAEDEVVIPMTDESGDPIDYNQNPWTWSGEPYQIPATIECYGSADIKGAKTLRYTFTDNYDFKGIQCMNDAGDVTYIATGLNQESIGTNGSIYKMPIEEGTDYTLKYYYEDHQGQWQAITDSSQYYRKVKAVIEPEQRAEERSLRIANNNGAYEKVLNSSMNHFTFKLKDRYGYSASVDAEYANFDEQGGTIEYYLSTTAKTKDDVTVIVTAQDAESGVGSVWLQGKNGTTELTESNGEYIGKVSENGTYSIILYDKVGNKTIKSFHVNNIGKNTPTLDGKEYSTKERTSKNVSVTLLFSNPAVRIVSVEPIGTLQESQYSVNYSTSTIYFTESGSLSVKFEDDYGNEGGDTVTVDNIYKTPPALSAITEVNEKQTAVKVTFEQAKNENDQLIDPVRSMEELTVSYGGMARAAKDAEYTFNQNGIYTFTVYDKEGVSSYLTLNIDKIDTVAPKITEIRWSYAYDVLENGSWQSKQEEQSIKNPSGAGYRVASDIYPVTNQDVEVTVVTDSKTHEKGSNDDYAAENQKTYTDNGLYIFNMEKENKLTDTYGVDIEVIDKTPPVINLLDKNELVFYENPNMGEAYSKDLLVKPGVAFEAYDTFGKGTDLSGNVIVKDWGGFNADDITQNQFSAGSPYTITYEVSDAAHNVAQVKRIVRLVGFYDTVALVNGALPDSAGRKEVTGDTVTISLKNFSDSGMAYVRYQSGLKTMGQMKKSGTLVEKNQNGEFSVSGLETGWYTFYVQTDKRDYFTLQVYVYHN